MNYNLTRNCSLGRCINNLCSKLLIISMLIISLLLVAPLTAIGSDLDDFEEAATAKRSSQEPVEKKKKEKEEDRKGNLISRLLFGDEEEEEEDEDKDDFFLFDLLLTIIDASELSNARLGRSTAHPPEKIELRQPGEPTLPFFQIEENFIRVNSDLSAFDTNLEFGYGPYGLSWRYSIYQEKHPRDELTLSQLHLLLRFSTSSAKELGVGIGSIEIRGNNRNSGFSLTTPLKVYLRPYFGIRIKPSFGWINDNYIGDYDLSLAFTQRYFSAVLGYRFLEANGVDLNGAYADLTFHY